MVYYLHNNDLMPDQPQPTGPSSPSNVSRINAVLSDLNTQRQNPSQPMPPPTNLPTNSPQASAPAAQKPAVPPMPAPIPVTPRPVVPAPRPPTPPTPAPSVPIPPKPVIPTTAPVKPEEKTYTSELRTMSADIGRITTGQPPVPTAPRVTAPAAPIAPTPPSSVVIPPDSGSSGIGRKLLFAVIGVIMLGALWWLVSLFINSDTVQETPTPTPTATATLTPTKNLQTYFRGAHTMVTLPDDSTAAANALKNALVTAQPTPGQFLVIDLQGSTSTPIATNGIGVWKQVSPVASTDLESALGNEAMLLAFGQTEEFNAQGQLISNAPVQTRLIAIMEVTDATRASQALGTLEAGDLPSKLGALFNYDFSKKTATGFASGAYRQNAVRYWNFPYADHALDWSIVAASNSKNYLVITGSRESMFYAIDQLLQ